ncbi:hypothetical protein PFISCL1PPCAC_5331, partial [Pristionchus fissidentatus]
AQLLLGISLGSSLNPFFDLRNAVNFLLVGDDLKVIIEESRDIVRNSRDSLGNENIDPSRGRTDEESTSVVLELLHNQGEEFVTGGDSM